MRHARLGEAKAGIKIARRNTYNPRPTLSSALPENNKRNQYLAKGRDKRTKFLHRQKNVSRVCGCISVFARGEENWLN